MDGLVIFSVAFVAATVLVSVNGDNTYAVEIIIKAYLLSIPVGLLPLLH